MRCSHFPQFGKYLEFLDLLSFACDSWQVEKRFKEEDSRVHHYLSSQTNPLLLDILDNTLLEPHLLKVINKPSGLDFMIDSNKYDDLERLCVLCLKVSSGLRILRTAIKDSIVKRGNTINEASQTDDVPDGDEDQVEGEVLGKSNKGKAKARAQTVGIQPAIIWVEAILNLKDHFDDVWRRSFKSNREIEVAMIEVSVHNENKITPLTPWHIGIWEHHKS